MAFRTGVVACALLLAVAVNAHAEGGAIWRFAPALAPAPPTGVTPAPYPVPLGEVGQISFWAPNRGLLITGGTENGSSGPVASGLYAYDGVAWHQLATVCGGAAGRIAWAGPDEFWAISDQRPGQLQTRGQNLEELRSLSLCHFLDGQVVGSYALPLGEAGSYLQMDGAACLSPQDCWFAGQDGRGTNTGSFHLHWDGSGISVMYDTSDHAVSGMVNFNGRLFEGLAIGVADVDTASEDPRHPAVIRTIAPSAAPTLCNGAESIFCDAFLFAGRPLPAYPSGVQPDALGGFDVATDGSPLGAEATQLWAAANPVQGGVPGSPPAPLTILRNSGGSWTQVLPAAGPSPLGPALLGGSAGAVEGTTGAQALAPEPGTESAWVSLQNGGGGGAEVALLAADGTVIESADLPGSQDPVGFRGVAGPIACPAQQDCWMATMRSGPASAGWLFHLSGGSSYPQDTDPNFAGLITHRPPDAGVPVIYPDAPPVDDSLANQQQPPAPIAPAQQTVAPSVTRKAAKQLVLNVKSRFLHHRVLVVSFTLTAAAHVQLIGHRHSAVVAKTRNESLKRGHHQLSLSLNPKHWPTRLQFKATPASGQAPAGPGGTGSGSATTNDTVSTG